MKPVARAGLVVLGYVAAVAIAWLVVAIHIAATSGPEQQADSGMYAFGDSLLFLAVFGLAAVPATAAALFFLRPRPAFWVALAVASLVLASTALAAVAPYVAPIAFESRPFLRSWAEFSVLRILVAPLFAVFFLLGGLFTPSRSARIALLVATSIETATFAYVAFTWFRQSHQ